jgi:hypothetical protein
VGFVGTEQWTGIDAGQGAARAGLRFGSKGTHTSRTIMLAELTELLASVPVSAARADYELAVVEDNVLGKPTAATRRLTYQRLRELYGLDPAIPLFRVLRRLWIVDEAGRPRLALLCALARDPLLRLTAPAVLGLQPGEELVRSELLSLLRESTGDRLNDAILDKVARNAASSWTQSGHLGGRVRKTRKIVEPTLGSATLALWLGALGERSGGELLVTPWVQVFDVSPQALLDVVLKARQLRLLYARVGGDVVEIDPAGVDPGPQAMRP